MTVEEKMTKLLEDNGMFPDGAKAVIERAKTHPLLKESMGDVWKKEAAGYPLQFFAVVWFSLKKIAVEYIDETCPEAWYRPVFADK